MPRETPRPVYLPNTPKFVFGADDTELALSLPSTLWDYAVQSTGGSIEGDSGRRAAFIIRRDELITFTLRFFESEWVAIQHFLDHVQDGKSFTWIPDQLDQTTIYNIQLVHPAVGEKYEAVPNPDYPLVQMLTLTVMKGATESITTSGAFVRPEIVYIQGEESHGQINRVRTDTDGTAPFYGFTNRYATRDGMQEGTYQWHANGGRHGGSYVTTVANTVTNHDGESGGQYTFISLPLNHNPPVSAGMHRAFNLFGRTLTAPINIMAMAEDTGSGKFSPNCFVSIMPNRTIQVRRAGATFLGEPVNANVGPASTFPVPATGWFALDWQRAAATGSFDEYGYTTGAALIQYYDDATPPQGIEAVKALNVDTGRSPCYGWAWGSETTRAGVGFTGLGMDDGVCYVNASIGSKRFLGESFVIAYKPSGPGAKIAPSDIQSRIGWQSGNVVTGTDPDTGLLYDFPVGGDYHHGVEARWKNVTGDALLSDDDLLIQLNVEIQIGFDEFTEFSFSMGAVTPATHTWRPGPYWPPYNHNQGDNVGVPHGQQWDESEEARFIRNTFASYTDSVGRRFLAREMYTTATMRSGFKSVEGIQQYARFGVRWLNAAVEGGSILSGAGMYLNIVSEHSFRLTNISEPGDGRRHDVKFHLRIDDRLISSPPIIVTNSSPPYPHWRTLNGTVEAQFLAVNPRTEKAFTTTDLDHIDVGAANDFTAYDQWMIDNPVQAAFVDPTARWGQFDLAEEGFEALIHTRTFLQREHSPFPPVAFAVQTDSSNLVNGLIYLIDRSSDWDGYVTEVTVDWGDHSPVEILFEHAIARVAKRHDYLHPGHYAIIVHAEDNDGLGNDDLIHIIVPAPQPIAAFHASKNSGDVSGLTIDFHDLSITPESVFGTNEIISWHWDFGDGSESSLQDPTHAFATAGTYPVALTVANDLHETGTVIVELDVPLVGASACAEFADVPPAFVQGDDLKGTNPPYPQYATDAQLSTFLYGTVYTGFYDDSEGAVDSQWNLDFDVTFDGAPTIRMLFGSDGTAFGILTGLYMSSVPSDGGYPDEQFYGDRMSPPYGPRTVWTRIHFKAEAGIMSDDSILATYDGLGLMLMSLNANGSASVWIGNRVGKIYCDLYTWDGANRVASFIVCDEAVAKIGGDGSFGEVGVFYEWDESGQRVRVRIWVGPACAMIGAEALCDTGWKTTLPRFGSYDESIQYLDRYNWNFSPSGPAKKLWHATCSHWFDFTADQCPYGYVVGA